MLGMLDSDGKIKQPRGLLANLEANLETHVMATTLEFIKSDIVNFAC